jgi:mannosyltransferase OCH1-like enzyme
MIPKTLHFIWMQGLAAMPANYRQCFDSWAAKNPGWTVKLWTEDDLPDTWAMNLATPTEICEVMRYEIVHREGGIYCDCDHECVKPIEPLVGQRKTFVSQRNRLTIENSGFGASAGEAWLGEVIQALTEHKDKLKRIGDPDVYFRQVVNSHPEIQVIPYWLLQTMNGPQDIWKHGENHAYAVHHRFALWTKDRPEYKDAYGKAPE